MTLHDAIKEILIKSGTPLSANDIALQLNTSNLYKRNDNEPIPVNQIISRVSSYKNLFNVIDGLVFLSDDEVFVKTVQVFKRLRNLIHNYTGTFDGDLISLYLIFLKRQNDNLSISLSVKDIFEIINRDDKSLAYHSEDGSFESFILLFGEFKEKTEYLNSLTSKLIRVLTKDQLNEIISLIEQIDLRMLNKDNFNKLFNHLASGFSNNKRSNEYSTPQHLRTFMAKILAPTISGTIYDPFAGIGEGLKEVCRQNKGNFKLIGYETNKVAYELAAMNFILAEDNNFELHFGDSFKASDNSVYDYILSDPPMGGKLDYEFNPLQFSGGSKKSDIKFAAISLIISKLKKDGKAVITLPSGFLYDSSIATVNLRKYLIDNDLLEAIFEMPEGTLLPYTNVKIIVLVINKHKEATRIGRVQFLSTQSNLKDRLKQYEIFYKFYHSNEEDKNIPVRIVENDKIKETDYILSPKRYSIGNDQFDILVNALAENKSEYKLAELVSYKFQNKSYIDYEFPLVRIGDLYDDHSDEIYLNTDKLLSVSALGKKAVLIDEDVLLLAKVGKSIKPSFFRFQDNKLVLSDNVLALNIDKSIVFPEYLVLALREILTNIQLALLEQGATIPFYKESDLLNLKIYLPTLEVQKQEVEKKLLESEKRKGLPKIISKEIRKDGKIYYEDYIVPNDITVQETELKNLTPSEAIENIIFHNEGIKYYNEASANDNIVEINFDSETASDIVRNLKHKLSQPISTLKNGLKTLQEYLHKHAQENKIISMQDITVPIFKGEDLSKLHDFTLEKQLQRLIECANLANTQLNQSESLIQLLHNDLSFEIVNLKELIKDDIIPLFDPHIITIQYEKCNLNIDCSRKEIGNLIYYVIENSIKHGIKDGKHLHVKIESKDINPFDGSTPVSISIVNDGAKFSESFSLEKFIRKNSTDNDENGTGFGGWLIGLITDKHHGKIELFNEDINSLDDFKTGFIFTLPKTQK
jgi:hypothetical protein